MFVYEIASFFDRRFESVYIYEILEILPARFSITFKILRVEKAKPHKSGNDEKYEGDAETCKPKQIGIKKPWPERFERRQVASFKFDKF